MRSVYLVSLGCAKNLVDSEVMLGNLQASGYHLHEVAEESDILLINTCGFIQSAVEEAIEDILDLIRLKQEYPPKKVVVVGCLVQRYQQKLADELPEVDLFIGTEGPHLLHRYLDALFAETQNQENVGEDASALFLPEPYLMDSTTPRLLTTGARAWLKITEGCDNRCTYCMIPSIRGDLRSRAVDDLVSEAIALEKQGVRELSIIAQDTTAYGFDGMSAQAQMQAFGKGNIPLVDLLRSLLEKTDIDWLRLLYLYPTGVSDQLLDLMAAESRIVPYLDIPIQHVSNRVLQRMNRRYSHDELDELIVKLRSKVPDISLRTTFLVGFPGEQEDEFLEIEEAMRSWRLDHVGVFAFADEEEAPSWRLDGKLPEAEKLSRQEYLLNLQAELSAENLKKYQGEVEKVLVEGVSSETELLLEGRTRYQAPEVDGCVYINAGDANIGDIVDVNITETLVYDLVGGIVED